MKKRIQYVAREIDESGKVISEEVIYQIDPIDLGPIDKLTEADKVAWLNKVEQNSVDAAAAVKKKLQSSKYISEKSK